MQLYVSTSEANISCLEHKISQPLTEMLQSFKSAINVAAADAIIQSTANISSVKCVQCMHAMRSALRVSCCVCLCACWVAPCDALESSM